MEDLKSSGLGSTSGTWGRYLCPHQNAPSVICFSLPWRFYVRNRSHYLRYVGNTTGLRRLGAGLISETLLDGSVGHPIQLRVQSFCLAFLVVLLTFCCVSVTQTPEAISSR